MLLVCLFLVRRFSPNFNGMNAIRQKVQLVSLSVRCLRRRNSRNERRQCADIVRMLHHCCQLSRRPSDVIDNESPPVIRTDICTLILLAWRTGKKSVLRGAYTAELATCGEPLHSYICARLQDWIWINSSNHFWCTLLHNRFALRVAA